MTESPLPVKVVTIAVLVWAVMLIKSAEIQPFIYFQFWIAETPKTAPYATASNCTPHLNFR